MECEIIEIDGLGYKVELYEYPLPEHVAGPWYVIHPKGFDCLCPDGSWGGGDDSWFASKEDAIECLRKFYGQPFDPKVRYSVPLF